MDKDLRICFIGSGAISTAMGNVLAQKEKYEVFLLSVEQDVVDSISNEHINRKYFPNIELEHSLKATFDKTILKDSDIIFLGIPSSIIVSYIRDNAKFIGEEAIIVNLAKGFGDGQKTIPQALARIIPNQIVSLKGPSFAREIINNMPTAFTLASKREKHFKLFELLFKDTSIYLDYTTDVMGVELASILKNIYAIIVGIVDAHFDSPNLRSLILTKAINEMRVLISKFGGEEYTMFNYCGFGDFTLTALNDLSRNRTLGLLIGKGFFTDYISEKVVLEGKVAVNIFVEEIAKKRGIKTKNLMLKELYKVFNEEKYDINNFVSNITNI
ncbi:MAG: glycerol-3-phosphate dehydrogenase [Bacteroidetes bacterium]|nr:glycerol-3-phosphate dehydrogenase [Bacteroidota bacterium]